MTSNVPAGVLEKIQKLLALAGNNPNEHEAASAAAKAQEMMQEYDLQTADVSMRTDARTAGISKGERITLRKKGKPGGWKVDLFAAVGYTTDCLVYASRGDSWFDASGRLIGRTQDIELALFLYEYLVREIERLQKVYGDTRWAELRDYAREHGISTHDAERVYSATGRHPLKAKESWVRGAVPEVIQTLYSEKARRDGLTEQTRALVVNKKAAIEDFLAQERGYKDAADEKAALERKYGASVTRATPKPLTKRQREAAERRWERQQQARQRKEAREWANMDYEAYTAGREDGRQIQIRPGIKEA